MRVPPKSLLVLVGPSGAGKSTWAARQFRTDQVVSSDALRALVGTGEHDQRAGNDAFALLDAVLDRRLARGLLTVVDTLGLDAGRRQGYVDLAHRHGFECHAVVFETAADVCRSRNRTRAVPVPAKVLAAQFAAAERAGVELRSEGFDGVHSAEAVAVVAPEMLASGTAVERQRAAPAALHFGLHLSSLRGDGPFAARLAEVASIAEGIGFSSLWVMDHVIQIPQVGRQWEDIPESWTTIGWLAAHTDRARLGVLVTNVTLRNPAHLAKIVATADVLSDGRVVCGVGAGWWEHENRTYGWPFPAATERLDLLEDTLRLLPVMWGPGSPAFAGRTVHVPEALCYPRPVQEHIPIVVGGGGEQRTLRLAAELADGCNLFGEPAAVRHKVEVLHRHCATAGRDPAAVTVSHLSTAVVRPTRRELDAAVDALVARGTPAESVVTRLGAGTVDEHVGRYRALAEAGVQTAIVALPDVASPGALESFGQVIAAFPAPRRPW